MNTLLNFWSTNKDIFVEKTLAQILAFAGNGKLSDGNETSLEFRELLDRVSSDYLTHFSESCLTDGFEGSGLALQDIINQIGSRLGFKVKDGLYRGKKNDIGYDGIWTSKEGYNIVIEVKTTDVYRINLDVVAGYRNKLVANDSIDKSKSSILLVVGRKDTGDLEAQIRGSKHAWDIRLLSIDSLLKLLKLKEELNDATTIQQINEILKPREYTRIDKLIELMFLASEDLKLEEIDDSNVEISETEKLEVSVRTEPVSFHDECIQRLKNKYKFELKKQTRVAYSTLDDSIGLTCSISKLHKGKNERYWFAFHPHQLAFLKGYEQAYVGYGCGSAKKLLLIPFEKFEPFISSFWTTEKKDRMYWHVMIYERSGKFYIAQPGISKGNKVDITEFLV